MLKGKTKTVEMGELLWTLVENDVEADYARHPLASNAQRYVAGIKRPAARLGAYELLDYYTDVVSSLERVEPVKAEDKDIHGVKWDSQGFIADLMSDPGVWVKLVGQVCLANRAAEVEALWRAAKDCNPHWYPVVEAEAEAETESKVEGQPNSEEDPNRLNDAEKAEVEQAYAAIDLDNPTGADHPDSETLMLAATKTVNKAEKRAKEAGKIGPATFPRTRKGEQ